jgi:predicted phage terminase large subunit-like protein
MGKKRKTSKSSESPAEKEEKAVEGAAESSGNAGQEPSPKESENQRRGVRAKLKNIVLKTLDTMPKKIEEAPLNQLTATAGFALDRIDTIDTKRTVVDSKPLYFSRLTDEELKVFERIISILLGEASGPAIPENRFTDSTSDSRSAVSASLEVEPVLFASPLRSEEEQAEQPNFIGIPKLHQWLAEQLCDFHERRGSRLAVIAPRESAKTTWITLAYVLRCAVEGLERYILLLSDSEAQAEQYLSAIRSELENEVVAPPVVEESADDSLISSDPDSVSTAIASKITLAAAYPESCGQGSEWRKDHLRLRNGVLIESLGRGSKIRGRKNRQHRPTLIVIDDCQSNRDIMSSKERQNALDWFKQEVIPCGSESTNFISVGSALHREAVAVQAQQMPGWKSANFPAIVSLPERLDLWNEWELLATNLADDNRVWTAEDFYAKHKEEMDRGGVSFWPSYKPLSALMMKRAEIGVRQFETEYQGNPSTPEGAEWPPEYFDRSDLMFTAWPKDIVRTVIALDPSKGREAGDGDYQAIAIISLTRDGKIWADCECHREPVPEMVERAVGLAMLYRPHCLVVETNQGLDLLIPEFKKFADARDLLVPLEGVEHYRDSKLARIRRLGVYLSRGQIRVRSTAGGRMLVEQMREFPKGTHDDAPDALELGIRRLELFTTGK